MISEFIPDHQNLLAWLWVLRTVSTFSTLWPLTLDWDFSLNPNAIVQAKLKCSQCPFTPNTVADLGPAETCLVHGVLPYSTSPKRGEKKNFNHQKVNIKLWFNSSVFTLSCTLFAWYIHFFNVAWLWGIKLFCIISEGIWGFVSERINCTRSSRWVLFIYNLKMYTQ